LYVPGGFIAALLFAILLLLFSAVFYGSSPSFPQASFCCSFAVTQITAIIRFRKIVPIGLPWFVYMNSGSRLYHEFDSSYSTLLRQPKMLAVFAGHHFACFTP